MKWQYGVGLERRWLHFQNATANCFDFQRIFQVLDTYQSWHQLSSGATEILPIIERWSPHILSYLNFLPMKNTPACACNATRHNWLTASLTLVQERWQRCTTMDNCSLLNAPLLIFQGYCTLLPCHSALPWIWFYLLALGWSCWLVLLCICPNTEHFRDFSFSEGGGGGDYLY